MIEVFADADTLANAAAARIAQYAAEDVLEHGSFAFALAGGSTPELTYQRLTQEPLRDTVSWKDVNVFWGDERCVPSDDPRSNQGMARRTLLDHVPVYERHVHPFDCHTEPSASARAIDAYLHRVLANRDAPLDLVLLGLGDDGHTAALFPGAMALEESVRWTAATRKADEDFQRITMTLPLLNRARRAMFIVSGEGKAEMVRVILDEDGGPQWLPAARIRPRGDEPLWMIDEAAAALLKRR